MVVVVSNRMRQKLRQVIEDDYKIANIKIKIYLRKIKM